MDELLAAHLYRAVAMARGERTFGYLEQYMRTQWLDGPALTRYREERLAELWKYLREQIPFYRDLGAKSIRDLPPVSRLDLKRSGPRFRNPRLHYCASPKKTSGSTGEPVVVWRDPEGLAREQAGTWRGYAWAGVRPGSRQARFWGAPLRASDRWSARLKDFALNRKRFKVFNYTEADLERYLEEFLEFAPSFVYGYVSAVADFARFLLARGRPLRPGTLRSVVTTSEVLTEADRVLIESALGARIFNEYGCSELGTIAHECERGRLHVTSENLHLEILDEGGNVAEEGQGRVLATEFHNRVQPLVRYELGDVARLSRAGSCACGRALPVIEEIHGKSYDIILGPQGRKYFPEFFSYIFKEIQGRRERIRQFQVVQVDRDLRVNLVPGRDFHGEVEAQFRNRLAQEFGGYFRCTFNYFTSIPREKSGKLRQVKREAPREPLPRLAVHGDLAAPAVEAVV